MIGTQLNIVILKAEANSKITCLEIYLSVLIFV